MLRINSRGRQARRKHRNVSRARGETHSLQILRAKSSNAEKSSNLFAPIPACHGIDWYCLKYHRAPCLPLRAASSNSSPSAYRNIFLHVKAWRSLDAIDRRTFARKKRQRNKQRSSMPKTSSRSAISVSNNASSPVASMTSPHAWLEGINGEP